MRDYSSLNRGSISCQLKSTKLRSVRAERQTLQQLTTRGKAAAYKITRARILLKADEHQAEGGWKDQVISEALDVSVATIERVRQQFVEEGFDAVLSYKQRQVSKARRLDGEKEARYYCTDLFGCTSWASALDITPVSRPDGGIGACGADLA